jgi:hypothetical protein
MSKVQNDYHKTWTGNTSGSMPLLQFWRFLLHVPQQMEGLNKLILWQRRVQISK